MSLFNPPSIMIVEKPDGNLRNDLKLKPEQKYEIKISEVVYIGDKITKDGVKPDESEILRQSSTCHHRKTRST